MHSLPVQSARSRAGSRRTRTSSPTAVCCCRPSPAFFIHATTYSEQPGTVHSVTVRFYICISACVSFKQAPVYMSSHTHCMCTCFDPLWPRTQVQLSCQSHVLHTVVGNLAVPNNPLVIHAHLRKMMMQTNLFVSSSPPSERETSPCLSRQTGKVTTLTMIGGRRMILAIAKILLSNGHELMRPLRTCPSASGLRASRTSHP